MSKRDIGFYFVDIFIAISKIKRYCEKFSSSQDLLFDEVYWDAVMREFQIIGEATNILLKQTIIDDKFRDIVDFRNIIVHHYFGINAELVWDIIQNHLEIFFSELVNLTNVKNIDLNEAIKFAKEEQLSLKNIKTYSFLEDLEQRIKV
jgi:uncharacterized protein with HEPN domain